MKLVVTTALLGWLALAPGAHAATFQAYDNTGASTGGAGGNLNIGRQFTVTGTGITVEQLGVYDDGSNGLVDAHDVTLFSIAAGGGANPANTALATVNIPNGTAAPLSGGFRFESITPIFLPAGSYSVIAYGTNVSGGDPYGDFGGVPTGANNVSQISWDPYQFTGAASPAYPGPGDSGNHSSASFIYEVGHVPEPSSVILLGVGAIGLLAAARRRRTA